MPLILIATFVYFPKPIQMTLKKYLFSFNIAMSCVLTGVEDKLCVHIGVLKFTVTITMTLLQNKKFHQGVIATLSFVCLSCLLSLVSHWRRVDNKPVHHHFSVKMIPSFLPTTMCVERNSASQHLDVCVAFF